MTYQVTTTKPARKPNPNVIGTAIVNDEYSIVFEGREYWKTGKEGHSMYDGTPVAEYRDETDHRIWKDGLDRVHAD